MITQLPDQELARWAREIGNLSRTRPSLWLHRADCCTTPTMVALFFPGKEVFCVDQNADAIIISFGVLEMVNHKKGCRTFALHIFFRQTIESGSEQYPAYGNLYQDGWRACRSMSLECGSLVQKFDRAISSVRP